jgi:hypothetical protein
MSTVMNEVAEHWNMPWHAWLKSLAQTSKSGVPQEAGACGSESCQPTLGPGGSWLIKARGRSAPIATASL